MNTTKAPIYVGDIYVFLYQNLNYLGKFAEWFETKIYVFLYQNLNLEAKKLYLEIETIYVFLYQNLNPVICYKN